MIHDAIILAAIFASGGLIGYIVGSARGRKRGRDEHWVDCFLDVQKIQRNQRDNAGRFKTKTK